MPTHPHIERHFTAGAAVRDVVIGKADGLTALAVSGGIKGRFTGVPFLRSAGQTTAVGGLAACAAFVITRLPG